MILLGNQPLHPSRHIVPLLPLHVAQSLLSLPPLSFPFFSSSFPLLSFPPVILPLFPPSLSLLFLSSSLTSLFNLSFYHLSSFSYFFVLPPPPPPPLSLVLLLLPSFLSLFCSSKIESCFSSHFMSVTSLSGRR